MVNWKRIAAQQVHGKNKSGGGRGNGRTERCTGELFSPLTLQHGRRVEWRGRGGGRWLANWGYLLFDIHVSRQHMILILLEYNCR